MASAAMRSTTGRSQPCRKQSWSPHHSVATSYDGTSVCSGSLSGQVVFLSQGVAHTLPFPLPARRCPRSPSRCRNRPRCRRSRSLPRAAPGCGVPRSHANASLPASLCGTAGQVTASGRGIRGCGLLVGGFLAGIGFRSRMGAPELWLLSLLELLWEAELLSPESAWDELVLVLWEELAVPLEAEAEPAGEAVLSLLEELWETSCRKSCERAVGGGSARRMPRRWCRTMHRKNWCCRKNCCPTCCRSCETSCRSLRRDRHIQDVAGNGAAVELATAYTLKVALSMEGSISTLTVVLPAAPVALPHRWRTSGCCRQWCLPPSFAVKV